MNILDAAYQAVTSAVFSAGFPAFWLYTRWSGRYRRGFEERLGFIPSAVLSRLTIRPRLWIHAVSLGEIRVASAVTRALKERLGRCSILVSTATDHGFDLAVRTFGEDTPVIYAPVDAGFSVHSALRRIRPDAMVFLETELWPAWISRAHAMGIPTALVNGRISLRSFRGYRRLRPFFRHVLAGIDAFSMVGEADAERIRAMGADPSRVVVSGNAKYDLLASQVDPVAKDEMTRVLNLTGREPVLVAGSTRGGEEGYVLDAYERIREVFPETILVIAPRHTERAHGIAAICEARGLGCQLRSDFGPDGVKRTAPVVILNTFGELFRLYSVADIVFCGASLVPLGGQNPLEPAVWGKPVFYGPSMEDFPDAKALLEAHGAGGTVTGSDMLAERVIHLLRTPSELEERGRRARDAVLGASHAASRHARVVADLLDTAHETCRLNHEVG